MRLYPLTPNGQYFFLKLYFQYGHKPVQLAEVK